jgi:hypothetical protein
MMKTVETGMEVSEVKTEHIPVSSVEIQVVIKVVFQNHRGKLNLCNK